MSLNIKNERVHELARQAAERSGLSQTSVVERALEAYLATLDGETDARRRQIDDLWADISDTAAALTAAQRSVLSTDDLYDRDGLLA